VYAILETRSKLRIHAGYFKYFAFDTLCIYIYIYIYIYIHTHTHQPIYRSIAIIAANAACILGL